MNLSDFPVLFKAYLIFKDFSRKPYKFKYFSSPCEHCFSEDIALANCADPDEMPHLHFFWVFTISSVFYFSFKEKKSKSMSILNITRFFVLSIKIQYL